MLEVPRHSAKDGYVRMDGRVVIVTGAGRGLGRSHALLLAERGAAVVVNDHGTDVSGFGNDKGIARLVVEEIRNNGGRAAINDADISLPAGAQTIIDQALAEFGRLDAVINNAGILDVTPFEQTTLEEFERHWRIHLGGHYNVTKAAWPIFRKQRYGRIVMTSSGGGLYGGRDTAAYCAAKGAIQGLTRVLAIEGGDHGILANVITPGAFSRMIEIAELPADQLNWIKSTMRPELVSPVVLWLASDRCEVTGQTFTAWSGRVARVALGTGRGLVDSNLTAEMIVEQYEDIASLEAFYEPIDVIDEVKKWGMK